MQTLADSGHGSIVLQRHRQATLRVKLSHHIDIFPTVKRGRPDRRDPFHAKRPRHHYADAQHFSPAQIRLLAHFLQYITNQFQGGSRLRLLHHNQPVETYAA
ncbi:hypothetical protein D3C78_1516400 [compost metagenome]